MKRLILLAVLFGSALFAQDKVIDGVVYTEKVEGGEIIWVKKMVPKVTYVTVKKVVMVPAPVESHMLVVKDSYVNSLGQIITSNRAQVRRTVRRIDRRND